MLSSASDEHKKQTKNDGRLVQGVDLPLARPGLRVLLAGGRRRQPVDTTKQGTNIKHQNCSYILLATQ